MLSTLVTSRARGKPPRSAKNLERISVLELRATPIERFVDRALSLGAAWMAAPDRAKTISQVRCGT